MCEVKTKKCTKCGEEKPMTTEYFYRRKESKDGLKPDCKICFIQRQKKYYVSNKNKRIEYQIDRYNNNRQDLLDYQKKHNKENREQYNQYRRNKLKTDELFSITYKLRGLILNSLKRFNWTKKSTTFEIIGCSPIKFKKYFEKLFQPGMTWQNHGEWHYDHIIPLSSATTEEEVIKLNHYTNLQPLWAEDNLRKSDKISEEWGNV